ncbi:hypothetical protein KTE91_32515, partial [Burkholderia multivorans]|uniref:hypothetical protein n=1 Tax=Burkholderia multivorans TaxID=87883 RepID=UPI001C244929
MKNHYNFYRFASRHALPDGPPRHIGAGLAQSPAAFPFIQPFNSPCRKNSYTVYRQILHCIRHFAAPCRFVWKATLSLGHRRRERTGRQVLELGHAQVGDGDEVL